MNIDAGARVCPLGHDPRDERDAEFVQNMRHALDCDGFEIRIREDDFIGCRRRGIAFEGSFDIGGQ